jgi:hypothetical protein
MFEGGWKANQLYPLMKLKEQYFDFIPKIPTFGPKSKVDGWISLFHSFKTMCSNRYHHS